MSKYDALWAWIRENGTDSFNLTFAEIKQIAGVSIDHSFLASKKELMDYGYKVGKISMKEQTVVFQKLGWRAFEKPLEFTNRINMEGLGMNGMILLEVKIR